MGYSMLPRNSGSPLLSAGVRARSTFSGSTLNALTTVPRTAPLVSVARTFK